MAHVEALVARRAADEGSTPHRHVLMGRLGRWWNDHPQVTDGLLAVLACGFLLVEGPYYDHAGTGFPAFPVSFWADLLVYASLALRRRFPAAVLTLVWTLWLLGGRWDIWAAADQSSGQ
ncbi:hypothetical protein ABT158_48175 [Nonomuraea sp. NPDC001636]|uniref:DUF7134 domain-containing protein n=1 Tax=Nonomuraea sp. NPDC001636 TaxID=3154391 RepID=UPI00331C09C1